MKSVLDKYTDFITLTKNGDTGCNNSLIDFNGFSLGIRIFIHPGGHPSLKQK